MHPEKEISEKTFQLFWRKEGYEGGTNENNRNTHDSRSENDNFYNKVGQRSKL